MRIDAVGVASHNVPRSVDFYRLLGFVFENFDEDAGHVEAEHVDGEVRLMIDDARVIENILGSEFRPANTSAFALLFDTPELVDQVAEQISDAGFVIIRHPWDTDWGQRYAVVEDPAGYRVDLFANLDKD